MTVTTDNRPLTNDQVAAMAGLSPNTIQAYRGTSRGPAYYKTAGRVWFNRAEVEKWIARREAEAHGIPAT